MDKREAIIDFIVQDIISYLVEENHIEIDAAMNIFYNSWLCDKLHDVETGLYLEGSAYVYDILKDEIAGKLGSIR